MKRCNNCGAVHTRAAWKALPSRGEGTYDGTVLDHRNCRCGSTLVVEIQVIDTEGYEVPADDRRAA